LKTSVRRRSTNEGDSADVSHPSASGSQPRTGRGIFEVREKQDWWMNSAARAPPQIIDDLEQGLG